MDSEQSLLESWQVHPVTPDRWPDLEQLFGRQGAFYGCWCMWWRIKRADFDQMKAAERKQALKELADAGTVPGLLGYVDGRPVGWISVGPRQDFGALERSTKWKRLDQEPVWSVVCFYVHKEFRRQGVTTRLLQAAVAYAGSQGARIVEGYPNEPDPHKDKGDAALFRGVASAYYAAGFVVAQENPLIVRCTTQE